MDFMITTTPSPANKPGRPAAAAFTLAEVMIAGSIGAVVLMGVLSTFLFLGRSQANVANYADMEHQAREGLEYFAQDVRQASELHWNSATNMTIRVKGVDVTYAFNSGDFTRTIAGNTATLIEGISDFAFSGYMITGAAVDMSDLSTAAKRAAASSVTKQVQISLRATRSSTTVTTASNTVLSARFILRNKRVTT